MEKIHKTKKNPTCRQVNSYDPGIHRLEMKRIDRRIFESCKEAEKGLEQESAGDFLCR